MGLSERHENCGFSLKVENENFKEQIYFIYTAKQICFFDNLNDLESVSYRNNLIFRGLKLSKGDDYNKLVRDFINYAAQSHGNVRVNRALPINWY